MSKFTDEDCRDLVRLVRNAEGVNFKHHVPIFVFRRLEFQERFPNETPMSLSEKYKKLTGKETTKTTQIGMPDNYYVPESTGKN
ncbi:hypothetical protein GCK72_000116 [Caenorhabditis remanei]|uniref:Uncharacterized protein n=1 Tax=Caenorhabditis remanei TaxID=31234 RepID=A0A6A5HNZ0_CAERE|nr:hypothetical protein GCK72_000116 [Caenorhabditis remanei]KAF1768304.1 hypothetical protein GCK72_000116 [Caenorhabditis remanei]